MTTPGLTMKGATASAAGRRRCLTLLAWLSWPALNRAATATGYPATIAALQAARAAERSVHEHYVEFSLRAQQEGYRGVAYLFAAFAASEAVHASNFGKVLTALNVELAPLPGPAVRVGGTRENLMRAANGEMQSIETFYPRLLAQIQPEGHVDAITMVGYAWSSEQQHRDKIQQIQRWSGAFFETVARTIDEKTGRYFVCLNCGATVNAVPADLCAICKRPPTQYRGVDPPP